MLLDTQLLLWALARPSKLPAAARRRIESAEVFVSAASIWEIAVKSARGTLRADPREVVDALEPAGFSLLSISGEHAARIAELPPLHADPFDRLLIAQALVEPMILLTNDVALYGYGELVVIA